MDYIKSNYTPNFGARIQITKKNLNFLTDAASDGSLLSATASSMVGGTASQVTAFGPALHISAQTPQVASIPEFSANNLPHSVWNFLQQFIKPTMGIKEDATVSSYSSVLGTFLQKFGKSGYNFCEFGNKGSRKFPS